MSPTVFSLIFGAHLQRVGHRHVHHLKLLAGILGLCVRLDHQQHEGLGVGNLAMHTTISTRSTFPGYSRAMCVLSYAYLQYLRTRITRSSVQEACVGASNDTAF